MQTQRRSMAEASSEASYYEREMCEDEWGSRSTLSHLEEVATGSSVCSDAQCALRAERDVLARALAAERARSQAAARAHDARLAELHGVIAELVRRRAQDKQARAIPEEELSDECESTTQPAGELDNDGDRSRTEQNESSSLMSNGDVATSSAHQLNELPNDTAHTAHTLRDTVQHDRCDHTPSPQPVLDSNSLAERENELGVHAASRCSGVSPVGVGSCEREKGSSDNEPRVFAVSPGRCESRQAKLAARVRLRKTEDTGSNPGIDDEASVSLWQARCARLEADVAVLQCALHNAADTQHRLWSACAVSESVCVSVCLALRCADRALEAYDVLLALAETNGADGEQREAAERVAHQLLSRLEAEESPAATALGEPLLSPGPWLQHDTQSTVEGPWTSSQEASLRRHAARLKAKTVALRKQAPAARLFSYHDIEPLDLPKPLRALNMCEMEAAVMLQELLSAKEQLALDRVKQIADNGLTDASDNGEGKTSSTRRRRDRHWLDAASETDL